MRRGRLRAMGWAGALGLLSTVTPARAEVPQEQQQPAPIERKDGQTPTIHVESRLVNVALNVVDETGAPVGGLTKDDFEIAEDGKPQKISVFDRESTTPLEIVLAIDTSGSVMIDERLEVEAAKSFVRSIVRPQDALDVMVFSDDVTELVPFTNDTRRIDSGLGHIGRGDATALYDAIYLASQRLSETPVNAGQRRVVVLITDGENTTHHGAYDTALEQAERAGAMVYSLIIVPIESDAGRNTGGEHALIQMARDTGGKYYYVEDKHDLAPAFAHVSDDLRTQYTLGYYAPQQGGDVSGLRHIEIRMKNPALREKYKLRYRTAYYGNR
jgi:Ca-activated chloride channel homolog